MARRPENARTSLLIAVVVLLLCGALSGLRWRQVRARSVVLPSLPAAFAEAMPRRVLWAWEEPEDLHTLSPEVGVAYLAETLELGERATVVPRRQPLKRAAGAAMMAVVRIETRRGFRDTPEMRAEVAARLAEVGGRGGVRALQIDFDATASQIGFYAGVLRELRMRLPKSLPLSITALASWCGRDSWLRTVPVDEAVPMLFRMGGPRERGGAGRVRLVEARCRTSLGVATDEPWRIDFGMIDPGTRIYVFAPRPWQEAQLRAAATRSTTLLARELAR